MKVQTSSYHQYYSYQKNINTSEQESQTLSSWTASSFCFVSSCRGGICTADDFHALTPVSNIWSTSSSVRCDVSGYKKKTCSVMTVQNTPNIMYVFHWMLVNAGATKYASAKLKIQLPAAERPTPLARYFRGNISDEYTHAVGAYIVSIFSRVWWLVAHTQVSP